MENNINRDKRLVIPKWRRFSTTSRLGELGGTGNRKIEDFEKEFNQKKKEWKKRKDFMSATELLVYNEEDDIDVKEAIEYIKINSYNSEIIDRDENDGINLKMCDEISRIKAELYQYPKNAIRWVDLSLCYTIINHKQKAIKAMKIALQLDKCNRFIIRSAVRLFIHYGEFDYAYYILKKSELVRYDPWVNATYIAVSQMLDKSVKSINDSKYLIESNNFDKFSLTELTCSLGNLELVNGKEKNAKKLFKEAIIKPNDNVAAQIQWISKNLMYIQDIEQMQIEDIKNNFEFATIEKCYLEDFEGALKEAKKWKKDDLISTAPNMIAATLYSSVFEDYEKSEQEIQEGIKKEKNNTKLYIQSAYNNINLGNFEKAEEILNRDEKEYKEKDNEIFVLADKGMLMYRRGLNEVGERYYMDASNLAGKKQMPHLKAAAMFHLAKEKYRIHDDSVMETIKEAKQLYKYVNDPVVLYNIKKFEEKVNNNIN